MNNPCTTTHAPDGTTVFHKIFNSALEGRTMLYLFIFCGHCCLDDTSLCHTCDISVPYKLHIVSPISPTAELISTCQLLFFYSKQTILDICRIRSCKKNAYITSVGFTNVRRILILFDKGDKKRVFPNRHYVASSMFVDSICRHYPLTLRKLANIGSFYLENFGS